MSKPLSPTVFEYYDCEEVDQKKLSVGSIADGSDRLCRTAVSVFYTHPEVRMTGEELMVNKHLKHSVACSANALVNEIVRSS